MTDESKPQKLTVNDPVTPEVLASFNQLEEARLSIASRLLQLEQTRVKLLAGAHQVDQQQQRLFEQVLVERGLSPASEVSIDSNTGVLQLVQKPESTLETHS